MSLILPSSWSSYGVSPAAIAATSSSSAFRRTRVRHPPTVSSYTYSYLSTVLTIFDHVLMSCGVTRCRAPIQARARPARLTSCCYAFTLYASPVVLPCGVSPSPARNSARTSPALIGAVLMAQDVTGRSARPVPDRCVLRSSRGAWSISVGASRGRSLDVLPTPAVRLCASLRSTRA